SEEWEEVVESQRPAPRQRARDLGISFGSLPSGRQNAITDVAGVRVGHATVRRGQGPLVRGVGPVRTGVTAILPPGDNPFALKFPAAAEVFNGYGKTIGLVQVAELGQLETPILLTNTLNVGRVADALVGWMVERHPAIGVTTGTVNPVVAECNDGYLNDIGGRHVGETETRTALASASGGAVEEGNLGAGTGMSCYGWAGGIGTASRLLPHPETPWTLGTLVLANFGCADDLLIAGVPVGRGLARPKAGATRERGSIIVIVATDAPLDARQLGRIARRVPLGLARTGAHGGHGSGDVAIAFSTANPIPHEPTGPTRRVTTLDEGHPVIDEIFRAVIEATEEAVINALCAAQPTDGRDDHQRPALPHDAVRRILRQHGAIA
ncbi:MAG TPA: P1 family peptidase, partial [Thermomicrobiales bacterium]